VETHFSADESSIRVLQIYCQLGHFTKLMRIFDPKDITSIMFYASLCDYDEPCVDSSLGEQVCALPSVLASIIRDQGCTGRRDWPNPSSSSTESSIRAGTDEHRSY